MSNATCLTHVFFKLGKEGSTLWCSLTRRKTHKTNEAVFRQVALDKWCHPTGAPAAATYEGHSGGIVDTLADLADKAKTQLEDARGKETKDII